MVRGGSISVVDVQTLVFPMFVQPPTANVLVDAFMVAFNVVSLATGISTLAVCVSSEALQLTEFSFKKIHYTIPFYTFQYNLCDSLYLDS